MRAPSLPLYGTCTMSTPPSALNSSPAMWYGVPGYEAGIWLGLMAPAGTPRPILERLSTEVNRIISLPEVKEAWTRQGAVPMGMSIDLFDRFLRDEIVKWAQVVKVSGAKVD